MTFLRDAYQQLPDWAASPMLAASFTPMQPGPIQTGPALDAGALQALLKQVNGPVAGVPGEASTQMRPIMSSAPADPDKLRRTLQAFLSESGAGSGSSIDRPSANFATMLPQTAHARPSFGSAPDPVIAADAERLPSLTRPNASGDQLAAAGDLWCQGLRGGGGCQSGGSWGTTGMYNVTGRVLCSDCAVKALGIQNESPGEKLETLMRFILQRR
jgi:hypothetical protein